MADDQINPFDAAYAQAEQAEKAPKPVSPPSENPFDQVYDEAAKPPPSSSTLGAFGRSAARSAVPSLGGLAGAGAGAEIGAGVGAFGGPVGAGVGGFVGGLAGAMGASALIDKAQTWALRKLPESWQDKLGVSEAQDEADASQHGMASFLGGLAPFALTMNPMTGFAKGAVRENATALERLMANPYTARLFGGAIQGGMELGNEAIEGQPLDWQKVGVATAFGLVFNKPNAIGEAIEEAGAHPVRNTINAGRVARALDAEPGPGRVPNPVAPIAAPGAEPPSYPGLRFHPTIAQAGDLKVAGPGMTEDVFLGSHQPSDIASQTAQEQARAEASILDPRPSQPDVHDVARRMEPELFQHYDSLQQQREQFRSWLDEQNHPTQERIAELNARKAELEQQIAETKNRDEQRRLRTQLRLEVQSEFDRMAARSESLAKGEAADTPEMAAARAHMIAVDEQMRDIGPQVAAAYRRAADAVQSGTVEHPIVTPEQELGEHPAPAPEARPATDADVAKAAQEPAAKDAKPLPAKEPNEPFRAEAGAAASAPAAPNPLMAPAENALPTARPISEQRARIAADVKKQLVAAGRPAEEAEAAGNLVAARYVTRAAQFKGAIGSPEELYRREGAVIKGVKPAERRAPLPKEPDKAAAEAVRRSADPEPDPVKAVEQDIAPEPALTQHAATIDPDAVAESLTRGELPKLPPAPIPAPEPRPIEHVETTQAHEEVEQPAHGASDEETAEIGQEFAAFERQNAGEEQITHVFDPPAKKDVVKLDSKVKVYHTEHGWMTVEQAKARIAEWKAHAEAQGETGENHDKIVLSLFDLTGQWSKPWEEAGYQVYRFDIQADPEQDVHLFSHEYFADNFGHFDGGDIHAILAACPCTDFASSGSRHFAAKDADGRTQSSIEIVRQTLATIEHFKPAVWAIENPVGRIEKLGGLPPWRSSWQPNHFGDPYTKRTLLWGRFNGDMPIAPVEPTEGSKMHTRYGGKSQATKNARSETPEGFAYSFFMANNAADHPVQALAGKYDRLDRGVIEDAVKAGLTDKQISDIVDDHYYIELDDKAAEQALRDAVDKTPEPTPEEPAATPEANFENGTAEAGHEEPPAPAEPNMEQLQQEVQDFIDGKRDAPPEMPAPAGDVPEPKFENATPSARKAKPAKEAPDVRLKDFKDQEVHGHDDASEARKAEFLKDGQRYLTSVSKTLTESGWEAKVDRKGKPGKPVSANPAGPAVAGDVYLRLLNTQLGVNVEIDIGHGSFKNDTYMVMRVGLGDKRGGNVWLDKTLTAKELVAKIEQAAAAERRRVLGSRAEEAAPADDQPPKGVDETAPLTNVEGEPQEDTDGGIGAGGRPADDAGEAVRGGAQDVPPEQPAAAPQEPTPIRRPPELSATDGNAGGGDAHAPDGAAPPLKGGAGEGVSRPDQVVTKPPAVGAGSGAGQPDTPAAAGVRKAARQIIERTRSNYRITDEDAVGQGGPKEKISANIEAIRILKAIEDEARGATPEEKAKLVKYTGWGAFAQDMFSPLKDSYKREREALRSLLNDAEYEAARASTLNAHYTSPDVIRGMWDALTGMGYEGGLAIEPSAGIGHFIGLTPDSVAPKTAWTAVELDSVTGRIAKALYTGAEVNVQGFETLKRPSNYYDLAISNVPFGDYNLREKPYGAFPIHDFFFVKSLDKVRPGGVVAFVTSRYTMDKLDGSTRRLLAKSADFVGAIRLPGGNKGAFAGNAGTAVTTDIIFLRKRIPGEDFAGASKWLDTKEIQTPEGPAKVNEYFADNPHMMLGEMRLTRGMYSEGEPTLVGETDGLREKIAKASENFPEGSYTERSTPATDARDPESVHSNDIDSAVKEGAFFVKDGKLFKRTNGAGVEHKLSAPDTDRVSRLAGIRDLVNELLRTQLSPAEGANHRAEALREELRTVYDDFVKKHGPINKEIKTVTTRLNKAGEPVVVLKRPNIAEFLADPDGYKVAAIENYDPETGKAERAGIQLKDVIAPPVERQINSPADALAATLDAKGQADLQHIGNLMGAGSEEEVVARLGDLIYQNPNGRQWEPADKYLSGDVVAKLEEARELAKSDASYLRNVAALEKVQPTPLTSQDIVVQFGAPWVPPEVYRDFLTEVGGSQVKVALTPVVNTWKIEARGWSRDALSKFGTDRVKVDDIVDAAMHNRQITVYDKLDDDSRVINQAETEKARIKVASLQEAFSGDFEAGIDGWVWQEPDRTQQLEALYNRTFNNLASRKFDGSHQTFPGLAKSLDGTRPFELTQHQKDAVWRTVQNGNTLLAHVVGAGKTFTMIASGMEQRRLGLIKKPMYVVPNHMLEQFSREFLQAYPNAKILVAQKDEMTRDARKAFISKVAANDWDGIVITHDAFGRVNMTPEYRQGFIRDQLEELERIREAEAADTGAKSPTVKELEKAKKRLQGKLDKLMNEDRKDEGVTFEESGVDHLFVDEAHLFKNLAFATRLSRVKGLAQGESQRAEDLFLKMRYLEQKRPGRSGIFATGTPVSNTMAELWTMQRYLQLDRLKERGLDNFDSWASTFGKIVNTMELAADGRTYKEVSSFSKFVNVPELISLYSEVADTKTADMLNLPRPELKTRSGAPGIEIAEAEPSAQEEAHIEALVKLAESLKGKRPLPGEPNMLSVVTEGRKVATDGRLIDPDGFAFNPNGKIAKAVENISRIYKEGEGSKTAKAQMVFLDMGVPSGKGSAAKSAVRRASEVDEAGEVNPLEAPSKMNLYADLKERLVAQGIPANEIAFIHDAPDDAKKAALFAKVRSGEVRVIIGSSSKMGVGTNVQRLLIAMHHLDAPWKPAEVEQRDGRIMRQGNLNSEVQIYRYITKRSFDAFMWQKLDTKSKFIAQVLSGAKGSRHAEDIDSPLPEAAEMKAAASGDPRIMEHAELDRQVRQLSSQKRVFDQTVSRASWELGAAKSRVEQYEAAMGASRTDAGNVQDVAGDKFSADLGQGAVTERKAAGEAIRDRVLALDERQPFYGERVVNLGKLSGFDMALEVRRAYGPDGSYVRAVPTLVGEQKYSATDAIILNKETDPVGLMRRFERILPSIAQRPAWLEQVSANERKAIEKLELTAVAKWPREAEFKTAQQKLTELTNALKAKDEKPAEEVKPAEEGEGKEFLQTANGKIRLAPGRKPVITLMETADASTFIHETGHDWLEQLMRDSDHPAAPDDLKTDAQTVLDWLGAKDAASIKTKQHEKFARGFEQYMREGRAPSQELAGVFAKFRNWLLSIYQTIKGLGKPISDDIRSVFDRMLSEEPQRTVIAPDRAPGGPSLADIHETDAEHTEIHEAPAAADRVEAESDRMAAEPPERIAHEIAPAVEGALARRAAQQGEGADGGPTAGAHPGAENAEGPGQGVPVVGGGGDAGTQPGGGVLGAGHSPVGERGNQAAGEGGAGGSGSEQRPVSGRDAGTGPALAPRPADALDEHASPFVDKAGNIRLDTLNQPETVNQAIRDAAHENDDFWGDRRGVISDGQVLDLADVLGMDAKMLSARKLGQAFNAEQIVAARKLLIQSATAVSEAMKKAAVGADDDVVAYAMARDRHHMIQAQVAGITAEAGRALRALRAAALEGGAEAVAVDQFIKQATGKTLFQLRQEAKLGAQLQTPQQVSKFMQDAQKPGFGRMVLEYWINGLISGPATHTTYSVGNTLLTLMKAGPDTLAAAASNKIATALGRQEQGVRAGESGAQFQGLARGFAPAVKAGFDALRTGQLTALPGVDTLATTPFQPGMQPIHGEALNENATLRDAMASAFAIVRGMRDGVRAAGSLLAAGGVPGEAMFGTRYNGQGYIPNLTYRGVTVLPVGDIARAPSRGIAAIHSFFRSLNYSMEKAAIAHRTGTNEGLEGRALAARIGDILQNPSDEVMAAARTEATDLTLMGPGSEFTRKLSQLMNASVNLPGLGPTQILKFVDPFVHISSNIIGKTLIERTPVGLLSQELRADIVGKNGAVAQDKAIGRMLMGSALALTFGGLAAEGLVIGSAPEDKNEAVLWKKVYGQPHSVRIGDMLYDVHRLGPLGMLLGISADMYQVAHKANDGEFLEAASFFHHAITQNILDESFMRGPSDLIKAVDDPGRYGDAYVRNMLASFVPFSVGMYQMNRAMDPYTRQAKTVVDAMKAKIPGLSTDLLPRRDIWGEAVPNPETFGPAALSAIYKHQMSTDPVELALLDLGVYPAQVKPTIRNVDLTPQEFDDYVRISGRMTKMRLDHIVASQQFQQWPGHIKRDVIQATVNQSREAARGLMLMKYRHILADAVQAKKDELAD